MDKRLKRIFFKEHPKIIAPKLLGKYLIVNTEEGKIVTKIVETEAYGGKEDLGCHVGRFGFNKRTALLFGKVGHAYIYHVHINTYCFNVVCHRQKEAGGILIRAVEPLKGIKLILKNLNRGKKDLPKLNGPGKVCRALKIERNLNGQDLIKGKKIYLTEGENIDERRILKTPRINIPYAGISKDWKWRFMIKDLKLGS